jgi:hypothetical protein
MALNFPSSPTNNQVFDNWIYSSAKGAWEAKPLTAGVATPSPTAPLAPKQGDLWYNTEDGNTYVWYTDVDGSQWVQLKSDATLSSTLGTRVEALEGQAPGTPGQPRAVATGSANISQTGSNASVSVTFPSGRFTAAPIVSTNQPTAAGVQQKLNNRAINITSTGCTLFTSTGDGTSTTSTHAVTYIAIQM